MKKTFPVLFLFSIFFYLGCQNPQPAAEVVEPEKDGIFIHISHGQDDPHRLLMALQMATIMAETKDVLVYLDIKGVEVVLNDAEDISFSHFPSSQTQLQKLIEEGVTIMACPGCLKVIDKTGEDLMDGVKVADKEVFFNFTKGRILTIDY